MKRPLFFLIITSLLLSACNFPLAQATPEPDILGTTVAKTLTAMPAAASSTPANPVQATGEPTATQESSPTSTPTEGSTPTATPPSDDPAKTLSQPAWSDPLDNGKTFWGSADPVYEDAYTRIRVENGAMLLTSITTTGWKGWRLAYLKPDRFYLEGQFTTQTCGGSDQYGLTVRAPDYESGYGYDIGLTCSGKVFLRVWDSASFRNLIAPEENPAIRGGSNQTNRLGIWVDGSKLKAFVNGVFIKEITDTSLKDPGYFGVFITGGSTPNFTVKLEELNYWNLP